MINIIKKFFKEKEKETENINVQIIGDTDNIIQKIKSESINMENIYSILDTIYTQREYINNEGFIYMSYENFFSYKFNACNYNSLDLNLIGKNYIPLIGTYFDIVGNVKLLNNQIIYLTKKNDIKIDEYINNDIIFDERKKKLDYIATL